MSRINVTVHFNFSSDEFISATFAQKKYLGWKDRDILANREFLRKDAEFQWELQQIAASGPAWKEVMVSGGLGDGEGAPGEAGMVGGAEAGSGLPPDFGDGAADTSGAGAEAPGEAPAEPAETSEPPPA